MVIAIIGADLSGLAAGRLLARAGHEVTVFEKNSRYGGRMAALNTGKDDTCHADYGLPYFTTKSDEFKEFAAELLEKKLIQPWGENFAAYDGEKYLERTPNRPNEAIYTSTNGMDAITGYLSRWVDIKTDTKVGGLTYFGTNRSKKRSWMVNLTSSKTFEADAVIIALPAPQAYGIVSTARDETNTLKIIRQIDEVSYKPAYSLVAGYGSMESPEWEGVICKNCPLVFVSNEALKGEEEESVFVLQASESFTRKFRHSNEDTVIKQMLAEMAKFTGSWASSPDWHQLHYWQYSEAKKIIDSPFLELEDEDALLALVGDYLEGNTVDYAYRSGYLLAKHWLEKY